MADRKIDPAEEPIHEVELWDLVSAFGRILREKGGARGSNIVYDDTPIHVYMQRIHGQLLEHGKLSLSELFQPHSHRSTLVGLFLATLELVRHHGVRLEQSDLFEEIWILPGDTTAEPINVSAADNYAPATESAEIADNVQKPVEKKSKGRGKGGRGKADDGKRSEEGA